MDQNSIPEFLKETPWNFTPQCFFVITQDIASAILLGEYLTQKLINEGYTGPDIPKFLVNDITVANSLGFTSAVYTAALNKLLSLNVIETTPIDNSKRLLTILWAPLQAIFNLIPHQVGDILEKSNNSSPSKNKRVY